MPKSPKETKQEVTASKAQLPLERTPKKAVEKDSPIQQGIKKRKKKRHKKP